jgi:muramidase (phage lysozyme)
MLNVQEITSRLSSMTDDQLRQYAQMHKTDPYILPLAASEFKRRQQTRTAVQGMQATPQPTVADATVAQMAPPELPEEQGIGVLPANNLAQMADGGIVGYAKGGDTFDPDKYLSNPNVQKFLAYINAYEGRPRADQLVGYKQFNDFSDHPRKAVTFNRKGDKSTAAGEFQILARTWDEQRRKLGLQDFSPENQRRAAVGILRDIKALDAIVAGDFDAAKKKAASRWASIPGSTIGASTGQKTRTIPQVEALLTPQPGDTQLARAEQPRARQPKAPVNAGLDRDLARRITEMLPMSSAYAADQVPRGAPMLTPSGPATGVQSLAGAIEQARARGQAPYSPSGISVERAPATGIANPALYTEASVPNLEQIRAEREAAAAQQPQGIRRLTQEILGAPEAIASTVTGAVSPLTGTLYAAGQNLMGTPMTAEEGAGAVTFAPRTEAGKESLSGLQRALEDYKIPPFVPGLGTARPKSKAGTAIAEADAAAAAAAKATEKTSRLRLAPPEKPAMSTATPEMIALRDRAVNQRRQSALVADQQAAIDAQRRAAQAGDRATNARILDTLDQRAAAEQARLNRGRNVLAPAGIGASVATSASAPFTPNVAGVERPYAVWEDNFPESTPAEAAPTEKDDRVEEAKKAAEEAMTPKQPSGGFTNEDILTMGLNMMMAPAGQAGDEISQLLGNAGRSGLATLAARRERDRFGMEQEKLEMERQKMLQDKAAKEAYSKYIGKLGDVAGRPAAEVQLIERLAEDQNIPFSEAYEQMLGSRSMAKDVENYYKYRAEAAKTMDDSFIKAYPTLEAWLQKQGGFSFNPKVTEALKLYGQ